MTAEELVSDFQGRGFDYLSSSKALGYINDAYLLDICEAEDWPFLEATATGSAPLSIPDLRSVETVINTTQGTKLHSMDRRGLTDFNSNLAEEGTPTWYYLAEGDTLKVAPVGTDSLSVSYYKVPERLSGSNSPIFHERWHSLIVDFATARAYPDSDDYELAQNARVEAEGRLQRMRESFLDVYRDGPSQFIQVTNPDAMC